MARMGIIVKLFYGEIFRGGQILRGETVGHTGK